MCEDLEDEDSLHTLFTIFKQSELLACVAPFACKCWPCMHQSISTYGLVGMLPKCNSCSCSAAALPPVFLGQKHIGTILDRPVAVVLLNDTGLFDLLFDEAHVMDFVGALEYEPGAPTAL